MKDADVRELHPVRAGEGAERDAGGADRAERLLTLTLRHADATRTGELVQRVSEGLAAELGARVATRGPREGEGADDAAARAAPPVAGDGTTSAPLVVRGHLVGYLDVTRSVPLDASERRLVHHLARQLAVHLGSISQQAELRVLAELTAAMARADSLEEGVRPALEVVLPYTGATAARLLLRRNDTFTVMGEAGTWSAEPGAPERVEAVVGACFAAERPAVVRDGLVACRLGDAPYRYALVLQAPRAPGLLHLLLPSVLNGARAITPYLEWLWREQVHDELLRFHGGSWGEEGTDELYGRLLDTAIRLVHGADSGSLLVRRSGEEPFAFQAVRGFDDEAMRGLVAPPASVRAWYGASEASWRRGRPRIVRSDEADIAALSRSASPELDSRVTHAGRIRANVCLPVRRGGEVLAILNLDNQHDPSAFGTDSLAIVDLFAAPLADILYRQHTQDLLRRAALTDPVTDLPNRRHLTSALGRELARQRRDGSPLSVLVMDLAGFKAINDGVGHEAGDHALRRVAAALKSRVRATDVIGRWGGDEFAAVLVDSEAPEAAVVAARLREAVAALDVGEWRLAIDVGVATAPHDGTDEATLIAAADRRMYRDKRHRKRTA